MRAPHRPRHRRRARRSADHTHRPSSPRSSAASPPRERDGIDPATRSFQALRIAVNDELGELDRGLAGAEAARRPAAGSPSSPSIRSRIAASSDFLRARSERTPQASRHLPTPGREMAPSFQRCPGDEAVAGEAEIAANPRARSARLRGAERSAAPAVGPHPGGRGMMRVGTLLWLALVAIAGFGLFQLKYRVQGQEQELARLFHQIQNDRDQIQVLRAEWAHLNDPHRLADLARRYLDLAPVAGVQIVRFDTLPARPTLWSKNMPAARWILRPSPC